MKRIYIIGRKLEWIILGIFVYVCVCNKNDIVERNKVILAFRVKKIKESLYVLLRSLKLNEKNVV